MHKKRYLVQFIDIKTLLGISWKTCTLFAHHLTSFSCSALRNSSSFSFLSRSLSSSSSFSLVSSFQNENKKSSYQHHLFFYWNLCFSLLFDWPFYKIKKRFKNTIIHKFSKVCVSTVMTLQSKTNRIYCPIVNMFYNINPGIFIYFNFALWCRNNGREQDVSYGHFWHLSISL